MGAVLPCLLSTVLDSILPPPHLDAIALIGCPMEGRSRRVRVYRLWMCEDWTPHEGQEAVGEVVCSVSVISQATSTSSTWISGKSGMMIIGYVLVPQKANKNENLFNPLLYHN